MERALTSFIRALRAAGAEVSSAEAIDAARALAVIGYGDRDTMKTSLATVLAKSEEEKTLHDELFEVYFSRPDVQPDDRRAARDAQPDKDREQATPGEASGQQQAGGAPGGAGQGGEPQQGEAASAEAFLELARSNDPVRIAVALERAAAAAGVDDIRFASQAAYYTGRMLRELGVEALERRLSELLSQRGEDAQAQAREMMDARASLRRQARAFVDQRFASFGRAATESFMNEVVANRAIGELSPRDMERMKAVVARMAKRMAVRHMHRRRVRNRGQLDLRRTLRANAGHDGVPVELVWKRKRIDRPKIVAICDVSGSVARYVSFLLLFLYSLHEGVADLRAFAFSSTLRDVAPDLQGLSFEAAMQRILRTVGGGSTDYGQAFADLHEQHWDAIDRRTTILVLGDGRSNYGDPRLDIFQEAAERAKRVVWLCPEPPSRWGTGDSCVLQYRPHCTHLTHCATAADLERALDDILLAYES